MSRIASLSRLLLFEKISFSKDLLKARDQRQVDHEELSAWYANYQTERDRTAGGRSTGGITGFFKDKINDFKGIDPEKARQDRVLKLNAKVSEVRFVFFARFYTLVGICG